MPSTEILECLELCNITRTLRTCIKKKKNDGAVENHPKGQCQFIAQVNINCGIYQGDAAKTAHGYQLQPLVISYMEMDDIKVYAREMETSLILATRMYSQNIVLPKCM